VSELNLANLDKATAGGAAAAAAVIAFTVSPLVRFVSPDLLAAFGAILGVCLAGAWIGMNTGAYRHGKWPAIGALAATGVLSLLFVFGSFAAEENDAACAVIQSRMVSTPVGRGDNAAMFEALGCRPRTGIKSIQFLAENKVAPAIAKPINRTALPGKAASSVKAPASSGR